MSDSPGRVQPIVKMSPNLIDRLMKGAIDCHVHAGIEPFNERRLDALSLATQAKETGMRAMVIKSHYFCTTSLAHVVNNAVPDFLLFGSLALNGSMGGLNPEAVDAAAETGAKFIWMPTYSSSVDIAKRAQGMVYPIGTTRTVHMNELSITNQDGKLIPQMKIILEIIKSNNIVLATGHMSAPEIYAITAEARKMGIKVVVTHPSHEEIGSLLTITQQQQLASEGAYIEYTFLPCMPVSQKMSPKMIVENIKAIGVKHCILTTDLGQDLNPTPPEGFRMMIATMLKFGLSEAELEILVKTNPARLLGLD